MLNAIKTKDLPAKWRKTEKNSSTEETLQSGFTHNSINEGDELLFLLLPLDEVSFDQRLQLRQILLLTLPVDVLSQTNAMKGAETV